MNLHTLLTKHQIVHGLENDQSHIDAFVKELTELQLNMPELQDIELRGDIDSELRKFVPDIDERSIEVTGVPSSFTNLYTRAIVRSTQQHIKSAIKLMGEK